MQNKIKGCAGSSDGKESTCNVGDLGSIPGLGRSPRGGHGKIKLELRFFFFQGSSESELMCLNCVLL